jgi:transposase
LEGSLKTVCDIMIENGIRPLALGRKNFMFAGSEDDARRLAIAYSIIGTCINIRFFLNYVLKELPKRLSNNIDDLLPTNWKDNEDLK